MKILLLTLLVLVGCAEEPVPADPRPLCADLGCPDPASYDKACEARGECFCSMDRATPPLACRKSDPCDDRCVAISCGDLTPSGDALPRACTCDLADGTTTSCIWED